ncbi:PilW family protein [Trichloromonas sp.]|uniref:PilW family protein n=1 Tax=Trichloromonas sp. TaxID=3069249 RepID=UPI002A4D671A|nr:prepilin-type N-terminal cleavage/methylation domain-containing protein [Trichloromonas sp.]
MNKVTKREAGFTLIELLIVMVVMGLVITSVYSLFINSKKTATTSEEVVDVQQNLRIAIDTLAGDIRMAGFLLPNDTDPISSAPASLGIDTNNDDAPDTGTVFSLQTISSTRAYARVISEDLYGGGLTVASGSAAAFSKDDLVHVIRPSSAKSISGPLTLAEPSGDVLLISTDEDAKPYLPGSINPNDIVVKNLDEEPKTVSYWLCASDSAGDNIYNLVRNNGNTTMTVASNINTIDLSYILEDGTESSAPAALEAIRAIRLTVTGQTDNTKTGLANFSGVKTRSLQTIVKIQNAFGG